MTTSVKTNVTTELPLQSLARERCLTLRYSHWLMVARAYLASLTYEGASPDAVLFDLEGCLDPVLAYACTAQIMHKVPEFPVVWDDVVSEATILYNKCYDWRALAAAKISVAEPSLVRVATPVVALRAWSKHPHLYDPQTARSCIRIVADAARSQYQPYDPGAMFWSYVAGTDLDRVHLAIELVQQRIRNHQLAASECLRVLGVFDTSDQYTTRLNVV